MAEQRRVGGLEDVRLDQAVEAAQVAEPDALHVIDAVSRGTGCQARLPAAAAVWNCEITTAVSCSMAFTVASL